MSEAEFNTANCLLVSPQDIARLKACAGVSPRGRYRLCLHHGTRERPQEMLIVCRGETYMPPHRHPMGKSESYHLVEGSMRLFLFDDEGEVSERYDLSAPGGEKPFIVRFCDSLWHMPVATTPWLIYHETYSGPFNKSEDVISPGWAPAEDDPGAQSALFQRLGIVPGQA